MYIHHFEKGRDKLNSKKNKIKIVSYCMIAEVLKLNKVITI